MLVRIALALTCSLLVYAYAQLRSNWSRSLPLPDARRKGGERKDAEKRERHSSAEVVTARKEEEEEEVKRESTFSPASSCRNFQEHDPLLLAEFDDLLSGVLDFRSDSSTDDVKSTKNERFTGLTTCDDNLKSREEGEFVKCVNSDDNLDSKKYDSTSEDDEALDIFEALAFREDNKFSKGRDGDCATSVSDAHAASELIQLRNLVTELQDKEIKVEAELLEYYGLKEQEKCYMDLERQLRKKNAEIEKLNSKINTLETQKKKLSEELICKDYFTKDLEAAKAKIKDLQRQLQSETGQTKAHLLFLKQQVATLQETEQEASKKDFELEKKIQTLKELEVEVVELRRTNKDLQHQKRELMVKLAAAEAKIAELSKITESDLVARAESEASILRHMIEDLSRQVEGLQMNRFSEVEELVYLRWVNACLRYELRNHKTPPGKLSALELNKSLSPKSQERAKQLILEFAGTDLLGKEQGENDMGTISSQSSTPSEYGDFDDNSAESVPGQQFDSKKSGLIRKLKKWGRSKDDSHVSPSSSVSDVKNLTSKLIPGHRHSVSKGTLESLMVRNSSDAVTITTFGTNDSHSRVGLSSSVKASSGQLQLSLSDSSQTGNDISASLSLISTKPVADDIETTSNASSSFQLMPKSVASVLDDKYSSFNNRHKLALARERAIKEKADQARAEKLVERLNIENLAGRPNVFKLTEKARLDKSLQREDKVPLNKHTNELSEVGRLEFSELDKRAPRVLRPPPKPSGGGPEAVTGHLKVSGIPPAPPPPRHRLLGSPGSLSLPPPPPPPPPPAGSFAKMQVGGGQKVQRAPEVVEFYQSLMRRETRKDFATTGSVDVNVADVRNNMLGEIENRSAFLLAVKADVETQGEFVQSLAAEVRVAAYTNIHDVAAFVSWLDEELSFLVDERSVLKHFDWPESKADALREAAFEYQDLKKLENEISSYEDESQHLCDFALKKMLTLLEKVEQSIYALLRTRDMAVARYKEFNIPTYWLLDSGLIGKIKLSSVQLAQKYMRRVASELDGLGAAPEQEPLREFLLLQGVRFAFRVHQFAGGFDEESMHTFEDLRSRVHAHTKEQRPDDLKKPS